MAVAGSAVRAPGKLEPASTARGVAGCRHASARAPGLGRARYQFTPDEQRTVMTLWSIARSPLIMGGDLRHLDAPTLALLTNPEVLEVNQASSDNQPHFELDGTRIWSAKAENGDHYLALFNTSKAEKLVP